MPLFTPPTTDGYPVARPGDPGYMYWRHLGAWATGQTVWKDSLGVWHADAWPYQGGSTSTVHDWDGTTVTAPDEGLATALKVYLGGHVHTVTDAEAAELVAAGFGAGINVEDVNISDWGNDLALFGARKQFFNDGHTTVLGENNAENGQIVSPTGGGVLASNQRDGYLHANTSGWTDIEASTVFVCGPAFAPPLNPQHGLILRYQESGGERAAVLAWHDVAFGTPPILNIGVWRANLDGTGFQNRQNNWWNTALPAREVSVFPYRVDVRLVGTLVQARTYAIDGNVPAYVARGDTSSIYARTFDLDLDCGSVAGNATPVGAGQCGVIGAHLGTDPTSRCVYGDTSYRRIT